MIYISILSQRTAHSTSLRAHTAQETTFRIQLCACGPVLRLRDLFNVTTDMGQRCSTMCPLLRPSAYTHTQDTHIQHATHITTHCHTHAACHAHHRAHHRAQPHARTKHAHAMSHTPPPHGQNTSIVHMLMGMRKRASTCNMHMGIAQGACRCAGICRRTWQPVG